MEKALIAGDRPFILGEDVPAFYNGEIRDMNLILFILDKSGDLLYCNNAEGKYNTLLRDCLHEHRYDYHTGEVRFLDPERRHITLNIWEHEIATKVRLVNSPLEALVKADEGAAVGEIHHYFNINVAADGSWATSYGIYYQSEDPMYWALKGQYSHACVLFRLPRLDISAVVAKNCGKHLAERSFVCDLRDRNVIQAS